MNDFGSQFENSVVDVPGMQAGQTLTRVSGSYCQAISVQKPRNIERIEDGFLAEARRSGDSFFYSWRTRKGQVIEGPSVGLAMAFVRHWTNCAVELAPLHETASAYVFTATFVDIESGVSVPRQFFMPKDNEIAGEYSDNRKMEMAFAIGCSKAVRNVVVNFMPSYLVDLAIEKAKERAGEKIDEKIEKAGGDIKKVIDSAFEFFDRYDITEDRVLARFNCSSRYKLNRLDLIDIFADGKSLIGGHEDPLHLYPPVKTAVDSELEQDFNKEFDSVFGGDAKADDLPDDRRKVEPTKKESPKPKAKAKAKAKPKAKAKSAAAKVKEESEKPEEKEVPPQSAEEEAPVAEEPEAPVAVPEDVTPTDEPEPDEPMAQVVEEISNEEAQVSDSSPEFFIEKIRSATTIGELKEIQTEVVVASTSNPKVFQGNHSIADIFGYIGSKVKEIKGDE